MVAEAARSWTPTPRQLEVLNTVAAIPDEEYGLIGYGGAAGGAKTNLLAETAIEVSLQCPGAQSLVGRQHLIDLKTTTLAEFDARIPPEILHKSYDSGPIYREIRLPTWPEGVVSRVYFREVKDAKNSIGSNAYGWIFLEEAHEIEKRDILYLFSRLRHRPERKRGIIAAFNPFPSYVVDLFIDGIEKPPESDDGAVIHTSYIPARIADNPHLPPNYGAMMSLAYANDPFMLAVLLKGEAGVVPNAVYPSLKDPQVALALRAESVPDSVRFVRGITGWDWGTSDSHKSAGVLIGVDAEGVLWVLDAWESPQGSSNELRAVGEGWRDQWRRDSRTFVRTAAYDASQGSLADPLGAVFGTAVKGVRDVDGRIRVGRGLIAQNRLRFNWQAEGARACYRYLTMYHRDDDGRIVEEKDDMVDAWHYAIHEAEKPRMELSASQRANITGAKHQAQIGAGRKV